MLALGTELDEGHLLLPVLQGWTPSLSSPQAQSWRLQTPEATEMLALGTELGEGHLLLPVLQGCTPSLSSPQAQSSRL
jgi:hypothetical protein